MVVQSGCSCPSLDLCPSLNSSLADQCRGEEWGEEDLLYGQGQEQESRAWLWVLSLEVSRALREGAKS